jgi:type IV secretory pathway TraG/TraD family ATPase VirD4
MRRIIPLDFINNKLMVNSYVNKFFKFGEKKSLLVPDELANVIHFPDSIYNFTPSIKWLKYKVLPAPPDTPREGLYLGDNIYRGEKTKVHMLRDDRTRHFYIIGKSGAGKSVFLTFMARQDVWNGDGVCVIDPHGDLIEDVLTYVPKERAKDVVLFDPADQARPVGLNILEATDPAQMDMASSQATEIFIKLFGDEIFGPRIQHYFRNACLTLMESPEDGATLIDVPRIFTDEAFLKSKIKKIKNPVVKSFWEHEYANTGERERQEMIPYFSSKFGPFITNSIMRNTIGQAKSGFNIREIMDNQKILLINLSKGKIGDLNTQLLGLIIVAQIQMAAMSRADMPKDQRKDFYLYVDEFQNFATDSFATILSEARKYRLNLIMAHQYINQLVVSKFGNTSSAIKDAVFGNVGSMMSFKVGAEDAEYLAKEYAPVLSEQDVINIANYKAYLKLNINNTTSRPFSLQTLYDTSRANEELAAKIKQIAKLRYGRKREFVEKEIGFRIGFDF